MTTAVVGPLGFIGRNLCRHLRSAGHSLREIGRGYELNFRDCDTVYHVAGVTGGGQLLAREPLAMVGPNLRLALDVFDAAARDGVRHVIAMSSTTGYPAYGRAVYENEYFTGNVEPCYNNPGETRRFIERLGRMYPFDVTFIRCAGAYGPGDDYDPTTSHVIGATIRKVAERHDPIVCWGDGQDARDGTHIDDLCRALVAAHGVTGKQSINVGTGSTMTVKMMIDVLCRHAGYRPHVEYDLTKPRMIRFRLLDVTLARELLGWTAAMPMRDGLAMAYDAYVGARK